MRNHSAGRPLGDVIPQRLLWILSQPRPGKLGAEGVGPREGEGEWKEPPVFRQEGFSRDMEKGVYPFQRGELLPGWKGTL